MRGTDSSRASGREPFADSGAQTDVQESIESLRRRVIGAVRRTCPARIADQAEDLAQAVLLRLHAAGKITEGKRTLSSKYLARAAYGTIVDEIRRMSRRREEPLTGPDDLEEPMSPSLGPDREASSAEIARGIRECLGGMLRPRRLAVTLYLEGCTVREAAELLHWSGKKAENLVYRGLADLRECLRGKGLEP